MASFVDGSGNANSMAIAIGTVLAGLLPALIKSGAISQEAALEILDDALAELMPMQNMSSVPGAIALIEDLRRGIAKEA